MEWDLSKGTLSGDLFYGILTIIQLYYLGSIQLTH